MELVRRALASTRTEAQTVVAAGKVLVAGSVATKASRLVHPAEPVEILGPPPRYVSRGGLKLQAALAQFHIDPAGMRAIDVGSSTGGFTDCLLQHGARSVVAIDVGRNQLHERLRADTRVTVLERTDVRSVRPQQLGGPAPLVTADVSFISLRHIAANLAQLAGQHIVVLVKPQFEAGKAEAGRGRGVIRDPAVWARVLHLTAVAFRDVGAAILAVMASPVTGAAGNTEFFLHMDIRPGVNGLGEDRLAEAIDRAVAGVETVAGAARGSD